MALVLLVEKAVGMLGLLLGLQLLPAGRIY